MFLCSIIKAWGNIFVVFQNTKEISARSIIINIPNISQSLAMVKMAKQYSGNVAAIFNVKWV